MTKKDIQDSLFKSRMLYNVLIIGSLIVILSFENHLRKSFHERQYSYFMTYFAILIVSYCLFYICGKNPGYANNSVQAQEQQKEIELEVPIGHVDNSELSLEIGEFIQQERRSSLLSSHTAISNHSLSSRRNSGEERENHSIIRGIRGNRDFISPPSRNSSPQRIPEQRFCNVCNILQPYRTKHCHYCEKCIHKFDHHCVWIGNEIPFLKD